MTPDELEKLKDIAASMVTPHTRYILYQLIDEIDRLQAQLAIYTGTGCQFCINCQESGRKLDAAMNILERISDPTPSIGRSSFSEWELRQIAREALAKILGEK